MTADFPSDSDDASLVAKPYAGDNAEPLTVSEISQALKRTVEDRFGFVRLRGELSGVKRAASGHMYCALKDENAVLDGVMWRGNAGRLPFRPDDGLDVVAPGTITTYPGRSKYQIVIERMELAGEGALLVLLEKTKARLEAEGLFDPARKRPLPYLPRTIGVVTSPTGAVIRDILHRLADRFPSRVIVWPVLVQGQGAAEQVAGAVRGFSALPQGHADRPDLVIVARGGGSIEDLWSFNEEVVVRAIADCPIPTISAVGHETDTTLADYAADRRAPTPTAAAEMAVPVRAELAAALADFEARKKRAILRPVQLGRERLQARADRLPKREALLEPHAQRLDDLAESLAPDEVNILKSGGEYGNPFYYSQNLENPKFVETKTASRPKKPTPSLIDLEPYSGASDAHFYSGSVFGEEMRNALFIVYNGYEVGAVRRADDLKTGAKVVRINVAADGSNPMQADLFSGWLTDGDYWGRPVAIAWSQDGADFFVTDEKNRVIYRFRRP